MVYELSEKYTPDVFLFRESQQREIESVFSNYQRFGFQRGGNKLIIGATGVGKTALTTKIIKDKDNVLFVSARIHNTPNKILKSLVGEKKKCDTSTLQDRLITILTEQGKVIVVDEIDKCSNVYEIGKIMDTIYREAGNPWIIISNNWNILNMIPDDAERTLGFKRVEFHVYNALELREILNARLKIIEEKYPDLPKFYSMDDGWDDDTPKQYLVSRAMRVFSGSVRMMFDIAATCIINGDFRRAFMEEEIQKKNKDEWVGMLTQVGQTEKEFLLILLDYYKDNEKNDFVLTSEIHKHMPDLTSARISQITKGLSEQGIINIKGISSGRVGNSFRAVAFSSDVVKRTAKQIFTPWDSQQQVLYQ